MLLDDIRTHLTAAMRSGDDVRKRTLRLVIGEAGLLNATNDEAILSIMRKMIERNRETIAIIQSKPECQNPVQPLLDEIAVLEGFLPRMLSTHEIRSSLLSIVDELKACPKEGMAIGLAMKRLKEKGDASQVTGNDVRQVVLELRAEPDK